MILKLSIKSLRANGFSVNISNRSAIAIVKCLVFSSIHECPSSGETPEVYAAHPFAKSEGLFSPKDKKANWQDLTPKNDDN